MVLSTVKKDSVICDAIIMSANLPVMGETLTQNKCKNSYYICLIFVRLCIPMLSMCKLMHTHA